MRTLLLYKCISPFLVLFIFFNVLTLHAETLISSLSSHRVAISSNYTGADIVVFGSIEKDAQTVPRSGGYDIVITIKGPEQSIAVRKKIRFGPFWINREAQKFYKAPVYLGVLLSKPIDDIAPTIVQEKHRLGIRSIIKSMNASPEPDDSHGSFPEALFRLKTKEKLYDESDRGVTFLTPKLFRASAPLPATAPPGDYHIEITLLSEGVILARQFSSFEVVKIGFEQNVGRVAHEHPLYYAFILAFIAIMSGFLTNFAFRKS